VIRDYNDRIAKSLQDFPLSFNTFDQVNML
jgi:hypothetical protein